MVDATRGEREFVHTLLDCGWLPHRAPSSGSASKHALADVLAGNKTERIAGEVKTTDTERIYISSEQIDGLLEVAEYFQATPIVVLRFNRDTTLYVQEVKHLTKSRGDSYRIDKSVVRVEWPTAVEYLS